MNKQINSLQLVVSNRLTPHNSLPLAQTRQLIFETYMDGNDERAISMNLKIPVDQIRLTLRGYQEIHYRTTRRASVCCPRWQRQTEAEISAEVWRELAHTVTPTPPATEARMAA